MQLWVSIQEVAARRGARAARASAGAHAVLGFDAAALAETAIGDYVGRCYGALLAAHGAHLPKMLFRTLRPDSIVRDPKTVESWKFGELQTQPLFVAGLPESQA